jgi:hypothetical protein
MYKMVSIEQKFSVWVRENAVSNGDTRRKGKDQRYDFMRI